MISETKVKLFCKDDISKIENYDIAKDDKVNLWDCHHRLELTLDGEFANTRNDLKRHKMYYLRPYFELIFIKHDVHSKMHIRCKNSKSSFKGKHHSEETRKRISEALKKRNNKK